MHVSFQSTGPTNITSVEALNENYYFICKKQRGIGKNERQWGIEMNGARQLYLATYGRIDQLDLMVRKCNIGYVSWKYWHAAKNHALGIGLVTAYDMYCEVMKEALQCFTITKAEANKAFLDFHCFRARLANQGLNYDPRNLLYPGDSAMRTATQVHKKRRQTPMTKKQAKQLKPGTALVTPVMLKEASATRLSRLCGDLSKISHHLANIVGTKEGYKHGGECGFCGEKAWTKCSVCNVPLHHRPSRGPCKDKDCFMDYHNTCFYGMAFAD